VLPLQLYVALLVATAMENSSVRCTNVTLHLGAPKPHLAVLVSPLLSSQCHAGRLLPDDHPLWPSGPPTHCMAIASLPTKLACRRCVKHHPVIIALTGMPLDRPASCCGMLEVKLAPNLMCQDEMSPCPSPLCYFGRWSTILSSQDRNWAIYLTSLLGLTHPACFSLEKIQVVVLTLLAA